MSSEDKGPLFDKISAYRADFRKARLGSSREDDPVEREIIQSWDKVERFYKSDSDFPLKFIVLRFIASLRRAGYDPELHAGQSMYSLVLSRSQQDAARNDPECDSSFEESL